MIVRSDAVMVIKIFPRANEKDAQYKCEIITRKKLNNSGVRVK